MREEIAAGMRNALEKGESIEKAVQSFINAGYNAYEVRAVAQALSGYGSSTSIAHPDQFPEKSPSASNQQEVNLPQPSPQKTPKNGKGVLIAGIIISALIALSALGYLAYVLFLR